MDVPTCRQTVNLLPSTPLMHPPLLFVMIEFASHGGASEDVFCGADAVGASDQLKFPTTPPVTPTVLEFESEVIGTVDVFVIVLPPPPSMQVT